MTFPHYVEPLFRPPSEARSLILRVADGCPWNRCTFCGMYRSKRFRIRSIEELRGEIHWARESLGPVRKVFLADGDALVAKASYLRQILDELRVVFPQLRRVSTYASPQALAVTRVNAPFR